MHLHKLSLMALLLATPAMARSVAPEAYGSATRAYVAGRLAQNANALEKAAQAYAAAMAQDSSHPLIKRRAFELALAAGDEKLSFRLARDLVQSPKADSTLHLVLLTQALLQKDWKVLETESKALENSGFATLVLPVVKAWALEARGQRPAAIALLTVAANDTISDSYHDEHRAYLLARNGQEAQAAQILTALAGGSAAQDVRVRMAAAYYLQRTGRMAEARTLLQADSANNLILKQAIKDIASGKILAAPPADMPHGVARLYTRLAQDLARDRETPIALMLARLGQFMAPQPSDALITASEMLARSGQFSTALAALAQVPEKDPLRDLVRDRRISIYEEMGERRQALSMLADKARAADSEVDDIIRYADALRADGDPKGALAQYDRAMARVAQDDPRWQLWFLRGALREQMGDWAGAEADLRSALQRAPEEATLLNYLGYALLDRGLKTEEAQQLIQKAHALRPDDHFITDSLGWSYFVRGDYERAVPLLEKAFLGTPEDPTIGEHVGDAYWKVGRKLEARYRWQAALASFPADKQAERLKRKLDLGYDLATAPEAAKPVAP